MATNLGSQWEQLFGAVTAGVPAVQFNWFVLYKRGHAFLFLPTHRRFASRALMLYPAQTHVARVARAALRIATKLHLPLPVKREQWRAAVDNEFIKFVAELVNLPPDALVTPAVLAGNPAGPGPRYMLLLSDATGNPKIVVKTGISPAAKQLIRAEVNVLSQLPASLPGVPRILAEFTSAQVEAFALEFFRGDSPRTVDPETLSTLLGHWIDTSRTVRIADIPAWQRLAQACSSLLLFKQLDAALAKCTVHPVIWHGDFVPWNIKVNPQNGHWTVLDWERAELIGMPAWDWFHYIIQTEILVHKRHPHDLLSTLNSLLTSKPFNVYATRAAITGLERSLLIAYLLYNNIIIQPAEGLSTGKQLLDLLNLTA